MILVALAVVFGAGSTQAGGLYIQEFGTPTQATASAGAQAKANDASTAFHNPAGMTRLDDHALMVTAGLLFGDIKFDPDSDTPYPGSGDGGQQGGPGPVLGLHYSHAIYDRDAEWLDRVRLGFSMASFSAAVLDPDNDWDGRYEVQKLGLVTLAGIPSIAVRIHEQFSLGAGANLVYGRMNYDVAVPTLFPPAGGTDGQVEFDGLDDFAAGAVVSALWEPRETTRVGVIWTQEVDMRLSGDINFEGGINERSANITTQIPFAQAVRASIVHQFTPRLWLGASFRWEDWSSFEKQWVTVGSFKTQIDRGWSDTYGGALGGRWKLHDRWALLAGVGFDSSPVGASDRTADMPVDRQIRVGIGAQWLWTEDRTAGFNFSYANLGPAKIKSETLRGDYDRNQLFSISFYINWNKLPWSRNRGA